MSYTLQYEAALWHRKLSDGCWLMQYITKLGMGLEIVNEARRVAAAAAVVVISHQ